MSGTVPVWLVVGFLGAGKTTLLRRLVKSPRGRRLAYVVNEFSNVDVDAGLVAQEGGVSLSVAGGSIFCRCKVTEFVSVLQKISGGLPDNDGGLLLPEGVVIEASGMADPRSMRRLLAESGLDRFYHVAGVTALADPRTLFKLLAVLPNVRGQIEAADLVVLNKTDLCQPTEISCAREAIRSINPRATVLTVIRADIDPDTVLSREPHCPNASTDVAYGLCKDPRFERKTVCFSFPVDPLQIKAGLAAAGDGLYRAKGFVETVTGWKRLDWCAGEMALEEAAPREKSEITLIYATGTDIFLVSSAP